MILSIKNLIYFLPSFIRVVVNATDLEEDLDKKKVTEELHTLIV
jgi:hypothetical protein